MKEIFGNIFIDERGSLRFVNDFNMRNVLRMYCIEPRKDVVRAWQGHKRETKWFYAAKGRFLVKSVLMEDNKTMAEFQLSDKESRVLEIPGGYYNGFQALEEGSVLMVFSDFGLEESKGDDWRVHLDVLPWV